LYNLITYLAHIDTILSMLLIFEHYSLLEGLTMYKTIKILGLLSLAAIFSCDLFLGPESPPSPAPQFAVKYHSIGHTAGALPVDGTLYSSGSDVLVLGPGTLDRSGFTFLSWNTAPDFSGDFYTPGNTISNITSDLSLFAYWTDQSTYTLTFDANSADTGSAPLIIISIFPAIEYLSLQEKVLKKPASSLGAGTPMQTAWGPTTNLETILLSLPATPPFLWTGPKPIP
jgi:hypothetical protein